MNPLSVCLSILSSQEDSSQLFLSFSLSLHGDRRRDIKNDSLWGVGGWIGEASQRRNALLKNPFEGYQKNPSQEKVTLDARKSPVCMDLWRCKCGGRGRRHHKRKEGETEREGKIICFLFFWHHGSFVLRNSYSVRHDKAFTKKKPVSWFLSSSSQTWRMKQKKKALPFFWAVLKQPLEPTTQCDQSPPDSRPAKLATLLTYVRTSSI